MESPLLEHRLTPAVRNKIINSLETNERWNIIVEGLRTFRIPVVLDVDRMRTVGSRNMMCLSEFVLEELYKRSCSFDGFCYMLREFDLLEELAFLIPAEPMVFEVQPGNGEHRMCVVNGEELQLTCRALGVPRPTYQWYCDNTLLHGQTSSTMIIKPFGEENRGTYCCQVSQNIYGHVSRMTSFEVMVDLMSVRPELVTDLPRIRSVLHGQTLVLMVQAVGYPPPSYEWYRSDHHRPDGSVDESVMPNIVLPETSNILELKNLDTTYEGLYCCRIYNEAGEISSNKCSIQVFDRPPDYIASAKVALLIGNEAYDDVELQGLQAPSNDVATLAKILEGIGFHVIALHNLTRTEMYNAFRWFCRILPSNAYAFFYFAGHGFSKLASKFMMPIDCPKSEIQLKDSLCDEHLTQVLAEGEQLQLLVMLFDCCLVESRDLAIGRTEFEHDLGNCNIVLGTATRNYQKAYESNKQANGLFVNHLQSYLAKEIPIIEVLRANQRDFRVSHQQPTVFFSGADNCSLTDPVKANPELEEKLRKEVGFPTFEQEIYFSKTNERFKIRISKHKNCFLNSIDLEFPQNFTHNFSVQVNPQIVDLKVEQKVVTIHNIQRVKSQICVTVFINGLRQADTGFVSGPHDSYDFSIDCPIITKGQLWGETE